jgi:hypothetical protein
VCEYVCVCVFVCVCAVQSSHVASYCVCMCACACVYVLMWHLILCVFVSMYVHIYIYIYIYVCMYVCISYVCMYSLHAHDVFYCTFCIVHSTCAHTPALNECIQITQRIEDAKCKRTSCLYSVQAQGLCTKVCVCVGTAQMHVYRKKIMLLDANFQHALMHSKHQYMYECLGIDSCMSI